MEKINCILIDDEEKAIKSLIWELNMVAKEVNVVKSFTNPIEAVEFLKTEKVDCIFLDIEMPALGGMQMLNFFPNREFLVVFTTAYDQYAIDAIKHHAFDYLLKPIDSDDLELTIKKIKKELGEKRQNSLVLERISQLLPVRNNHKIKLRTEGKIFFLSPDEIIFCKGEGNYSEITFIDKKKLVITQQIGQMNDILPSDYFMRVHNSYIINKSKVKSYHRAQSMVNLEGGFDIPVSRNRKDDFLKNL